MVLNETLEALNDVSKNIQKTITNLKVHNYVSENMINDMKYIKAYKSELEMESELKLLSSFLEKQKNEFLQEMRKSVESASKEALLLKCKKIEDMFQQDVEYENEDFGEE